MKKIVYVDMDNVLVDFQSAFPKLSKKVLNEYENNKDDIPGIFALMEPMPSAIESFIELTRHFETYVLSTAPWNNSSAWSDKLLWVKKYLGEHAIKRLILTHHKNLNMGDYLIDDRLKRGADSFAGEHIHFGTEKFPDWPSVMKYLRSKEHLQHQIDITNSGFDLFNTQERETMANTHLTNQRQVFVEEYVRSGDQPEAAKKAGYKGHSYTT